MSTTNRRFLYVLFLGFCDGDKDDFDTFLLYGLPVLGLDKQQRT